MWKEKFEGFMLLTRGNSCPVREQRALLLTLLDEDWTRIVKYGLGINDDTPVTEVVAAMEGHLRSQRNVIIDRREFFSRKQEADEPFDDFFCALKEVMAFCDFCSMCADDQLRDRIVCGSKDDAAVQRMLETSGLTLLKAVDICRASENARATCDDIRGGLDTRPSIGVSPEPCKICKLSSEKPITAAVF